MLRKILEGRSWFRPIHSAYVGLRSRYGGHVNWGQLVNKRNKPIFDADSTDQNGCKILIATSVGGHLPSTTIESMLGVALGMRGAKIEFLLCDGVLPACMTCEVRWYQDLNRFCKEGPSVDHCPHCFAPAEQSLSALSIKIRRYSEYLGDDDRKRAHDLAVSVPLDKVAPLCVDGVPIGEHALAGAMRFFARGTIEFNSDEEAIVRCFLEASLLTLYVIKNLLSKHDYDCVLLHHGIYVPQGIIAKKAEANGVRVVTWHPAYRKNCFIFSHGDTYHKTLMTESVAFWENLPWSDALEKRIMNYLHSRWTGSEDWITFQNAKIFNNLDIESEVGVDFKRPCIGLLTNVFWDAQLHYPTNAFSNMLEWLLDTVKYFVSRPDLQLLIRVHPAEISGTVPSRQHMADELAKAFPNWPKNVFVIPAESTVSTYAAMAACDSVIIYGTKTGVELASMGIPVVVAGEAWIRGKGVTLDARSISDYYEILEQLPLKKRMPQDKIKRARKYAYHFFFRRMIPFDFIQSRRGWPPYRIAINSLDDLAVGCDKGLDVVCNGVINNQPFIYNDEDVFF